MAAVLLRDVFGVRSGDKGDISDLTLFADTEHDYGVLCTYVTAALVRAHFGSLVTGEVERFEAPNVWALKFVMRGALGGGAARSLRSDTQGKTLGMSLLRLQIDVPDDIARRLHHRARPPAG
jgi:hypothetical protein